MSPLAPVSECSSQQTVLLKVVEWWEVESNWKNGSLDGWTLMLKTKPTPSPFSGF